MLRRSRADMTAALLGGLSSSRHVSSDQNCLGKGCEQRPQVIVAGIGSIAVDSGLTPHGIGDQAHEYPIDFIVCASVVSYQCRAAQH